MMQPGCQTHAHRLARLLGTLVLGVWLASGIARGLDITLDAAQEGRVFEGIGAVSAGASSRLLRDYPEPQRSQILDYLFKPSYGASLQHLKVETGGDINSTDGTEPSHMHSRADTNYNRGYEWWLMTQARARNPSLMLDTLAWGAPGWVGNGSFYSQDMADYVVKFIQGARQNYGLDINFTGTWNEHYPYNNNWIVLLRNTLDANSLQNVGIIAADVIGSHNWDIAQDVLANSALSNAIYAIGAHYPGYTSSAAARACGKPLWSSEDGIGGPSWSDATKVAKIFNRNYIEGRMTKTEIWSPVTSYYDNLAAANSGLMKANSPWTGAYEISPAIWATAHTTQFAFPGWKYLEGGANGYFPGGGSFVTLKSTNGIDYSIIIETADATGPQTVTFHQANGLSSGAIHVWQTSAAQFFTPLADILPSAGAFTITLNAGCVYSLTTTSGQSRGAASPPGAQPFPIPYLEDFEAYGPRVMPKYLSDQSGVFETSSRLDGAGKSLRQIMTAKGIEWISEFYPYTIFGDANWRDYEVATDALIETNGLAYLYGRLESAPAFSGATPGGYWLSVSNNPGAWTLHSGSGSLISGNVFFPANSWHRLKLSFTGLNIQAYIDGSLVANVTDTTYSRGMAAIGAGWNTAQFDNLSVVPRHGGSLNLARGASASAFSVWSSDYSPSKANDGDNSTRWNSAFPINTNEWLELDFPFTTTFNRTALTQFGDRIMGYIIQHWNGSGWSDDVLGGQMGPSRTDIFPRVSSSKVRLSVTNATTSPSIYEFEVYDDGPITNLALNAVASASSVWSSAYAASFANDNSATTRWNAAMNTTNNQWLQLDFGAPVTFNRTVLNQFGDRVTGYQIQYWSGTSWATALTGGQPGLLRTDVFPPITASKVRFYITAATNVPSIYEFQVFNDSPLSSPIVINEWLVKNVNGIVDSADGRMESWFELYNPGANAVALGSYFLTSDPANRFQFQIPAGYAIPAGGWLLVWADGLQGHNTSADPDLHVNFRVTNAPIIGLFAPDGSQVDLVTLASSIPGVSSGSVPDGALTIVSTAIPTPRGSNNRIRALAAGVGISRQVFNVTFQGIPEQMHRIQACANLNALVWTDLGTSIARADGLVQFPDTNAPPSRRFYRAVWP